MSELNQRMTSDDSLIQRFKSGSHAEKERAFTELVMRYQERVYWVCRRLLHSHDDADDAAQTTFIKVYHGLSQFNASAEFFTWVYRIATNESLNLLRRDKHPTVALDEMRIDPSDDSLMPDEVLAREEERQAVQRAIQLLPEKQRVVFVLRYFEELSYEEISTITGTSVGGLKANYFHALAKVEEELKRYFGLT